jgi:glyoxylase-like metal-dependent hydrolase (beta-lactamase superfamily II)
MVASIRVGDLEIKGFSDGILRTSLDNLIGMERQQAEQLVGPTDGGWLFIPVNNFLIQRDGHTILIDAGAGNTMQPTLGRLPANLRAAGIDPSAISHVVLTHIHSDHANGLVDDAGQPHYPNAEIIVHEKEAAFWLSPAPGDEPENVRRNRARAKINLMPYGERLRRIRDGEEVLGLTPIPAPGHTPGHTCWRIASGNDALVAWGDLVHFSAIQISHPETAVTYDIDKDLARASRLRLLDMIATDRLAIAGAHVAAPGFGHVVRRNGRYAFEPTGF